MGLSDRDYYRDRYRRTASDGRGSPRRAMAAATSGWYGALLWGAVILAGALAAKWFQESRRDLPFPPTGQVHWYVAAASAPTAPLTVYAPPATDVHYVLQLDQWETKTPVAVVPVRGGEVARLQVPLGRYRVTLVKGVGWRGPGRLFRRVIDSREGVDPLDFYRTGNQLNGHTIRVETLNGNMEMMPARR